MGAYPVESSGIEEIWRSKDDKPIPEEADADGNAEGIRSKTLRGDLTGGEIEVGCGTHVVEPDVDDSERDHDSARCRRGSIDGPGNGDNEHANSL
jgi:hypothetical protein